MKTNKNEKAKIIILEKRIKKLNNGKNLKK